MLYLRHAGRARRFRPATPSSSPPSTPASAARCGRRAALQYCIVMLQKNI